MAILHVEPRKAIDDPEAYDLVTYHIPQRVDVFIARDENRFKLYVREAHDRFPCTLKEGSYKQTDLITVYVRALERLLSRKAG